jgi:hypothetical protein
MGTKQGDPALIQDPVAQNLLHSTELARLAYTWNDGTPRVIPSGSTGMVKRSSLVHPSLPQKCMCSRTDQRLQ